MRPDPDGALLGLGILAGYWLTIWGRAVILQHRLHRI